jgi:hypothetical protein
VTTRRSGSAAICFGQNRSGGNCCGVADLHFRFTLRDGLIASLVIEP